MPMTMWPGTESRPERPLPPTVARQVSNMALAVFVFGLLVQPLYPLMGLSHLVLEGLVAPFLFLVPLWAARSGHAELARHLLFGISVLATVTFTLHIGLDSNLHVACLAVALMAHVMFDVIRESRHVKTWSLVAGVGFVSCELSRLITGHHGAGELGLVLLRVSVPLLCLGLVMWSLDLLATRLLTRTQALQASHDHIQTLSREKEALFSTLGHELRTPLTAIHGVVASLQDGIGGDLSVEQQELVQILEHQSDRMRRYLSDVLDLMRMESTASSWNHEEVILSELIREACEDFRPVFEQAGIRIDWLAPEEDVWIMGDRDRLIQVMVNLLSNALKYTPSGGVVQISLKTDGTDIRLEVSDSGVGMSEADQARLFTRFFTGSNRPVRPGESTGLGLVICKEIVEQGHGGSISVQSAENRGTTFAIGLRSIPSPAEIFARVPRMPVQQAIAS
ncbi:MAG: HAMP domain-containing sensor histidine kinase [bacterium]|nr:HAMP domain-containing sensor histidine kinase [bacterium]